MEWISKYLRPGLRAWRRRPMLAAGITALLALSVGASTTVFSVLDAVVLQAIPFRDSDSLYAIQCQLGTAGEPGNCSVAIAATVSDESQSIDELGYSAYGPSRLDIAGREPDMLVTRKVASSFLSTLGVVPVRGRWFLRADNEPSAGQLVIVSERVWNARFGSIEGVVGSVIHLDGEPHTVVGVMPSSFAYPTSDVGAWVLDKLSVSRLEQGGLFDSSLVARLRSGASESSLRSELAVIGERLSAERPSNSPLRFHVVPLKQTVLGPSTKVIWFLFFGTTALLIIAAANLVNLLVAVSLGRSQDRAVRLALGATHGHLRVADTVEYLMLGPLVIVGATLIGGLALRTFQKLGSLNLSRSELAEVNQQAIAYAGLLSFAILGVAALTGFEASRAAKVQASHSGRIASGPIGRLRLKWVQGCSLALQLCMAVVLVLGALSGALLLWRVHHLPLGFEANNLLGISIESPRVTDGPPAGALPQLLGDIIQLPGVEGATLASKAPFTGATTVPFIPVDDGAGGWLRSPSSRIQTITPEYFAVLRAPVIFGRTFSKDDVPGAPCVAVVNESFARTIAEPSRVLGRVISANRRTTDKAERCSIVGVVADVRDLGVKDPAGLTVYFSYLQRRDNSRALLVRSTVANRLEPAIRQLIQDRYGNYKVRNAEMVSAYVAGGTERERLLSYVVFFFAGTGYCIALLGVYSIASFMAQQRRQEIGIRLAIGASQLQVIGRFVREHLTVAFLSVAAGVGLWWAAQRLISSWATELTHLGPSETLAGSTVAFLSVVFVLAFPLLRNRAPDVAAMLRSE